MLPGQCYMERHFTTTACFLWIIINTLPCNMIPTPMDSHRNADNTLPGIPIGHSGAIQLMERHYTTGYDFLWVTIHIGQSCIAIETIWSHRKAPRILSDIAILPPWWYLVNVRWKDNILSLHVSSDWICISDNAIPFPHQPTATGKPTTPSCILGYLSEAIWSIESRYTNEYDFLCVTIHIGQSNIVLKTIWSRRKAHRVLLSIIIFPSWCWQRSLERWRSKWHTTPIWRIAFQHSHFTLFSMIW